MTSKSEVMVLTKKGLSGEELVSQTEEYKSLRVRESRNVLKKKAICLNPFDLWPFPWKCFLHKPKPSEGKVVFC